MAVTLHLSINNITSLKATDKELVNLILDAASLSLEACEHKRTDEAFILVNKMKAFVEEHSK